MLMKTSPKLLSKCPWQNMDEMLTPPPITYAPTVGLTSANTYTSVHVAREKQLIQEQLQLIPTRQPIVCSDGSTLSNLAPCRGSAICYEAGPQLQPVVLKEPVNRYTTRLATDLTLNHSFNDMHIFSDCQVAITIVCS